MPTGHLLYHAESASSEDKLALCRKAGADETINYATEDLKARTKELTGGRGVNVVFDGVGGEYAEPAHALHRA